MTVQCVYVYFCVFIVLNRKKLFLYVCNSQMGFPDGSAGKDSACNAGVTDSVPRSGRFPGGGDGNLLQYSCLENPMDGGKGHKE